MHKVTIEQIEARIKQKYFFNLGAAINSQCPDATTADIKKASLTTVCVLILDNGFVIEGKSACVDFRLYDEMKGQLYAYENAVEKLWELEGYLLKNKLYEANNGI